MFKIWSVTIVVMLFIGLVFIAGNAPPINAGPASTYSFDFARFNAGGVFSVSAGTYNLVDEVRATGPTGAGRRRAPIISSPIRLLKT